MKTYLNAKTEAAKTSLSILPARLKAWPGKKWESTKYKAKTTNWPMTITNAIGWSVRHSILGVFLGMGFLGFLTEIALWETLEGRALPNEPIPVDDAYHFLSTFFLTSAAFGAAGAVACLVMNLHKLRLSRTDGHGTQAFLIEPTDEEAVKLVREIVEKHNGRRIAL